MTEYGEFISKGPYVTGAESSVDIAVRKDGRPGSLMLKRFHPLPSRQLRRVLALEAWRLSMERQQRAARAGAAAVEVLAIGSYPDGEYAVLPRNRRSLIGIVGAVAPTGDRLRIIVGRILSALKSWETHYGSPHGNLKPTNVFVTGEGTLHSLHFLLSDPSWRLGVSVADLRQQEMNQLGGLIVQMVRGREAGLTVIEDAPEWRRLGKAGEAWRDFSNFLLHTDAEPAPVTLEAIEARLHLIPFDLRPGRVAAAGGAGVSLLLCGAVVGYARMGDPQTMPNRMLWLAEKTGNPHAMREQFVPEWALLCRAWDDWVADLAVNAQGLEQTKGLWDDPDRALMAIADFRLNFERFRPQTIVAGKEIEGRSLASLAQNPPRSVRREKVVRQVLASWGAISALQDELGSWSRWTELRSLGDELGEAGKQTARSQVESLVPQRAASDGKPEPHATFTALSLLAANDAARDLLAKWKEWRALSLELSNSGDRVQAAMPRLALQALPDTGNLNEIVESIIGALSELRRRRALFRNPAVDQTRLLKESLLFSEEKAVGREDLAQWEREVKLFSRVGSDEDPRSVIAWDERLAAMQASAGDLQDDIPGDETLSGLPLLNRGNYESAVGQLIADLKLLRARDVLRRDLPDVAQQTRRLQSSMLELEQRLEATVTLLKPDQWLAGVRKRSWSYPAAQERWDIWRGDRLARVSASALDHDRAHFRQLMKEEQALRRWLAALDGPGGMERTPPLAQVTTEIQESIGILDTVFRAKTASVIVAEAGWKDELPTYGWEETLRRKSRALQALKDYRNWQGNLPRFAADLTDLNRSLAEGLSWFEGVKEALAQVERHSGADTLDGSPRMWRQTAQHLRDLAETGDVAFLSNAIKNENLAAGITAWKRLEQLPEWPADSIQLAQEIDFGATLRGKIATLPAGPRRDSLGTQLQMGQCARWVHLARSAVREPAQIDDVFSRASELGVDPNALDPAMTYNFRLWELSRRIRPGTDSTDLKTARDNFVAEVKRLSPLRENPDVTRFLTALDAVALSATPSFSPARTPREAGWKEELSGDGERLAATWSSGAHQVTLEYQLIEPSDSTPAFFLARRTLAVGEFLELMAAHPARNAVLQSMPAWVRGESIPPGNEIMAWRPRGDHSKLVLNDSWFFNEEPRLKELIDTHPAALSAAIDERPTPRSPLQFVSPELAKLISERMLGARLPTPAEWKALFGLRDLSRFGYFRSDAFTTIWNYTETVHSGGIALLWRPTTGAFIPRLNEPNTPHVDVDEGRTWPEVKAASLWPRSVDVGPPNLHFFHLFGNIWIYLYDDVRAEYYTAGGSILSPASLNIREPQRLQTHRTIGGKGSAYCDGFTDVGVRPAFDAPANIRQRLELFRLVRDHHFITK